VTDIKTGGNDVETMSDRDFLLMLANSITNMIESLSDRLELVQRQADHIDVQVHEISQFIEEHRPALARGLALMSAGTRLGAWRKPKD
jgi:hypothetical protein